MTSTFFEYRFHAAGQGVFASGAVLVKGSESARSFNWVVDCGSMTPKAVLCPQIQLYRGASPGPLDLLCLTHFDEDHVNGLGQLIKGLHVDTIVIPHVSPTVRLVIAARSSRKDSEFHAFIRDPIFFFLRRAGSVRRIVVVSDLPPDHGFAEETLPFEPQGPRDRESEWDLKIPTRSIREAWATSLVRNVARRKKCDLLETDHGVYAVASHWSGVRWEFCFFHKPVPMQVRTRLRKAVLQITEKPQSVGWNDFKAALTDSEKRRRIKKSYDRALRGFETINSASLCIYAGPLVSLESHDIDILNFCHVTSQPGTLLAPPKFCMSVNRCSILYTGDADLRTAVNRQELETFLDFRWNTLCVMQVPHHGSKNNWTPGIGQSLPIHFAVFCADPTYRFGHPHDEVKNDFAMHRRCYVDKMVTWTWSGFIRPL